MYDTGIIQIQVQIVTLKLRGTEVRQNVGHVSRDMYAKQCWQKQTCERTPFLRPDPDIGHRHKFSPYTKQKVQNLRDKKDIFTHISVN